MAGADIDVQERNTTPRFAVGFGFQRADGNCFRYVHYGSAVAAGTVVGCSNTNNNLQSINAIVVATATADAVANEIIKPGAAGSRYVEITLTTVANNQYAGGYLAITKDTGSGYTYRIKGNTATGNPKSTTFRIELYEKIKVGLDNTSDIAITSSPYADLDEAATLTTTYNIVGVCMSAASADNWGWACTRGMVGVLSSNTGIAGQQALLGNGTTAGAVMAPSSGLWATTAGNLVPMVGYYVVPAVAGQQAIVYVMFE